MRTQPNREQTDVGNGEPTIEVEAEEIRVFHPQYVQAEALMEALQSVLGDEGRVTAMLDDNKVILVAPASLVRTAEELLRQIDLPRPQVRITALLYDVSVQEMERLGFNWSNARRGGGFDNAQTGSLLGLDSSNFDTPTSSVLSAPAAAGAAAATAANSALGGWLTLSHIGRHFDMTAIIQAINTLEGTRLLARPNILATDGSAAEFSAVSEIPVQQLTETAEGGSIGTTEFREAGIKLTVTPQIKRDGTVSLQVTPEFSVLAGFQDGQPIIDRRRATTVLQLHDGETVVIGGLLRRNEIENQRLFPGARKWKYLAGLFRDHEATITESELLVVVKAEIIGPEHIHLAREEAIQGVVEQTLEDIPYATYGAFVPSCSDPYCPLHNPRDYRNQGWKNQDYHAGNCAECTGIGGKIDPTFGQPGRGFGSRLPTPEFMPALEQPRSVIQPHLDREALPTPSPRTDGVDLRLPGTNEARAAPNNRWNPPPVIIDETARMRRSAEYRVAMRRLPAVNQTSQPADAVHVARRLPRVTSTPNGRSQPASREPAAAADSGDQESRSARRINWLQRVFGIQ